jgi:hypothetical protein
MNSYYGTRALIEPKQETKILQIFATKFPRNEWCLPHWENASKK